MTEILTDRQLTGLDDSHITWLDEHTGIHQQALSAWQAMSEEAKLAGFDLKIASGYRGFTRQLTIWNRKFSGQLAIKNNQGETLDINKMTEQAIVQAILYFSALPGASRHHWGCDIDIYAKNLLADNQKLQLEPWEFAVDGPFHPLSQWLNQHASRFGFYFPYDKFRGGVAMEPWHLSYWPIAQHGERLLTENVINSVLLSDDILGKKEIIKNLSTIYQQYIQNVGSIHYG
ncbi:M15 family metallopeptidase [Colwellia hornerae]|uniref:M15 family metallopeptidase n=1 Tax=Colwellia hornerae TaxID=89402 RepID=A0A5C6QGP7_9GAMM|nr:M15 family metallopeptidase [Colwellia hornerae]TWX52804.1 M15 family metallopeptidase [Colwellia hornerae]TWX59158.1 M15 family metallopeptidase [Colwellia hornerae]TWX68185.1 M15 family metallopeptidase [Colwellia hornerae]